MKIAVELDENDIRTILAEHIRATYDISVSANDLPIEVKSKQNYRSEWEIASIRINVSLIQT